MSRRLLILVNDAVRARAVREIAEAPAGSRLEIKGPQRTLPQNARMWAHLSDVSHQAEHCGRKYEPEAWKAIFMHALGREVQFLPALDGRSFIPIGLSSSDLSKSEMADLITFIEAWGAENGIEFHDPAPRAEITRGAA